MKNNKGFIEEFVVICVGLFLLLTILALAVDFGKTMEHSVGWVYQASHGTAVKEFQEEIDGCIYFTDVWDNPNKLCGDYQIKKF